MRIYTRTGDSGETGLVGGARVSKASPLIAAIGDVDELNACIGLCVAAVPDPQLSALLVAIQNWLFDLGAELAGGPRTSTSREEEKGDDGRRAAIGRLERSMDEQTGDLPPLRHFILPGGSEAAARLHHARCVCRRAERSVLSQHQNDPCQPDVIMFLNRLSDWLFVSARTANRLVGVEDVEWAKEEE